MISRRNTVLIAAGLGVVVLAVLAWRLFFVSSSYLDLAYGTGGGQQLTLDLDLPRNGQAPYPVVVFLPIDGEWHRDSKRELYFHGAVENLTGRGYAVASLHYRSLFKSRFPAALEDCKAAVRWLRAHAKSYRLDPDHIGVVGFSASGYLACLVGTTDAKDGFEGAGGNAEHSSRVQAVISFCGPSDMIVKDWPDDFEQRILVPYLGVRFADDPAAYRRASPGTYASADDPPFLFFHGTNDLMVPIRHARQMTAKLKQAGVSAQLIEVKGVGHRWEDEVPEGCIGQALDFLDKHLKR